MRIASWNISGFRKTKSLKQYDYEKDTNIDYFVDVIKKINPDILLLQESLANENYSYASEIGSSIKMPFYADNLGTKSYLDPNFYEATSIVSKTKINQIDTIEHINPHWEVILNNGYVAKSYDRSYQICETKYGKLVHVHFLPEKFFKKDYLENQGRDYIMKNLEILNELKGDFFFCGDLNTRHINEVFGDFFNNRGITNAFKDIPTRPMLDSSVLPQDVICYPNKNELTDKGVEKTDTDHYLIWADFEL